MNRELVARELVLAAKDLVAKWSIEYFPSTSNKRKVINVRDEREALSYIKKNNLADEEDLVIYNDNNDEYYYERGKLMEAADDNPWGWHGGDVIKHTEENIRRVKYMLKDKDWPEGYINNLKRTLKNLEGDLKEYKSLAKNASGKPTGKAQIALYDFLKKSGGQIQLGQIPYKMLPFEFSKLQSAAKALAKKGLIEYKGSAVKLASDKTAKTGIVMINNLWNQEKYFTRQGLDSTDRRVFKLVNNMDDVITMGKVIGVPVKFWKPQDRQDFRKHGLDTKIDI